MIVLENVSKKFGTGEYALTNISFSVDKGEFAFLIGPTGSGKTTIFRMLIKEMEPSQGNIVINTWNIRKLPGRKVPELRKKIGVVFQDLKLLPDRTVLENVILPLELSGAKHKEAKKIALESIDKVGMKEHANKFPAQLSGGEKQRAAIARALVLSPDILLADEPTGDLDDETAWEIVELLKNINESGTTVMMATHNHDIIKKLNKRIIQLNNGLLVDNKSGEKTKEEEKAENKEEKQEQVKEEKREEAKDEKHEKDHGEEHNKNEKHPAVKSITENFKHAFKK